jgi:hypothetical protein
MLTWQTLKNLLSIYPLKFNENEHAISRTWKVHH